MVSEAEKYKEEDKLAREKVDARNSLESYAYQVKNTLSDEKLKDKFSEADKTTISEKADEIISWLDDNNDASKEEYDAKQKELEGVFNPIMSQAYASAAPADAMPGGMPGGMPGETAHETAPETGPTVEEVD